MKRILRTGYILFAALAGCSATSAEPTGTSAFSSTGTPAIATAATSVTLAPHVHVYATAGGGSAYYSEACVKPADARGDRCHALVKSDASGKITPQTTPSGWGAQDLQSAYKIPTSGGAGTTVAVVEAFDDPNAESDLGVYRNQYGLPACTTANGCFKKVNQNGASAPLPRGDVGWGREISLDLAMVSAACPSCKILLVEGDLDTGVQSAVTAGATFISNSWGGAESSGDRNDSSLFNHPGVAIFASAGDDTYSAGAQYPASSAYVTAVGGTVLSTSTSSRGWSETVWSDSGSGCSQYVTKPSWQHDPSCGLRTVGDISAVADNVAIYDTFAFSRTVAAWNGRPVTRSQSSCFSESYASVTNTCTATAVWEMPLAVESGGPFTVEINVKPTSSLQSVGCMVSSLNPDSTQYASTYGSGLVYPTIANTAQTITLTPTSVPPGGTLYAACWLADGGRINSINWHETSAWMTIGGTSVSSPLVAGIYAAKGLVAQPSYSYAHTSQFFDVTSGSNGSCSTYLCNAGVGYDAPTGNGTPNGSLL